MADLIATVSGRSETIPLRPSELARLGADFWILMAFLLVMLLQVKHYFIRVAVRRIIIRYCHHLYFMSLQEQAVA